MSRKPKAVPVLQVEISGRCNLNCKMCAYKKIERSKGYMSLDMFERIAKQAKELGVPRIRLFVFGDPMLHPKFGDIVDICLKHGIEPDVSTNGNIIAGLKHIAKCYRIIFSVDGLGQEQYSEIRRGGDWNTVVGNIRKVRDYVKKVGSKTIVQVQTMLMDETMDNMDQIKKFWKREGVRLSMSVVMTQGGSVEDYGKKARESALNVNRDRHICHQPYDKLVVFWNGDIGFCCSDAEGKLIFSHVDRSTLKTVWLEEMPEQRRIFEEGNVEPCSKCILHPKNR